MANDIPELPIKLKIKEGELKKAFSPMKDYLKDSISDISFYSSSKSNNIRSSIIGKTLNEKFAPNIISSIQSSISKGNMKQDLKNSVSGISSNISDEMYKIKNIDDLLLINRLQKSFNNNKFNQNVKSILSDNENIDKISIDKNRDNKAKIVKEDKNKKPIKVEKSDRDLKKENDIERKEDEEKKHTEKYRRDVTSSLYKILKVVGVGAAAGRMVSSSMESELKNEALLTFAPKTNYERLKRIHTAFKRVGIDEDKTNQIISNLYRLYMQYQQTGKAPASAHLLGLDVFREDPTAMVDLIMKGYKQQGKEFFKNQILTDFFSGFESNVKMAFEDVIKAGGSSVYWNKEAKELAESTMSEEEMEKLKRLRYDFADFKKSLSGLFNTLSSQLAPALSDLAKEFKGYDIHLQEILREGFLKGAKKGFKDFFDLVDNTTEDIKDLFRYVKNNEEQLSNELSNKFPIMRLLNWDEGAIENKLETLITGTFKNIHTGINNWNEKAMELNNSLSYLTPITQLGQVGREIILNIVNKTGNNLDITTENQSEIDFIKTGF